MKNKSYGNPLDSKLNQFAQIFIKFKLRYYFIFISNQLNLGLFVNWADNITLKTPFKLFPPSFIGALKCFA